MAILSKCTLILSLIVFYVNRPETLRSESVDSRIINQLVNVILCNQVTIVNTMEEIVYKGYCR
jgi:hypothetical protein